MLDKAVFSSTQRMRIIGSFREQDNEFFILQKLFHVAEGIQALHRVQAIDGDTPQEGKEMPQAWVNE